jgi:hypothetical protein
MEHPRSSQDYLSGFTAFNTTTVFERTRQQVNCFVLALSTTQFDLLFHIYFEANNIHDVLIFTFYTFIWKNKLYYLSPI